MFKKLFAVILSLAWALLGSAVHAQQFTTTPNPFGYNSNGMSGGYTAPRLGGGYNYNNSNGMSGGYTAPRLGGGYNYYGR
jgi:hypothetical protein